MLFALVVEDINKENPVVLISNGELDSLVVLLNLAHLEVFAIVRDSEHFFAVLKCVGQDLKVLGGITDDRHKNV